MNTLEITPQTKVAELLEAHPQLEDVLIDMAPAFRKLKTPLLRRTIARVATLRQAAMTGDLPVSDVVGRLREAVGQPPYEAPVAPRMYVPISTTQQQEAETASLPGQSHARIAAGDPPPAGHEPPEVREARPDWARESDIVKRVDAAALLDKGSNPLSAIITGLQQILAGEVLYMNAPFYPAPMVDALRAQKHAVWAEESDGGWSLWIRKS
ncbi:MAG: DUF1858 domain-containing protein [Bacteroidetes bacterium]|nr:DUF1858 domain-containing protein [Bacteroidota bacterium]